MKKERIVAVRSSILGVFVSGYTSSRYLPLSSVYTYTCYCKSPNSRGNIPDEEIDIILPFLDDGTEARRICKKAIEMDYEPLKIIAVD